jgi:4-amino-4-deoxy-L-arabinose transferase-like glycosyltransferase
MGSPPASDPRTSISGAAGAQLTSADSDNIGNPQVTVTSTLVGQQLTVTLEASGSSDHGGKAIVYPQLDSPAQLTGPGFNTVPSMQSPLEPGESVTGTWTVSEPVASISVSYQELNCYKTSAPAGYGCIMDEVFYVPEGMGILNGQVCSTGNNAPTDCHLEHPYLVPALIAVGMAVYGQFNVVGWRLMPALLGTFSIPLLFGIAWKISGSKKTAYFSATLLALDIMFFSQSSAALLDVPIIFFSLAAFFAYFTGLKVWKFDKYVVAGALLGVAGLAKETAIFMVLALVTWIVLFGEGSRWGRVYSAAKVAVVVALVFSVGLQAYDSTMTNSAVPTFVQHVEYILSYGQSLNKGCPWACGWTDSSFGTYITPFNWVTYYSPVAYYLVTVCPNSVNGVCQTQTFIGLAYYGVTNFLETWTIYVWIPLVAYALYRYFRREEPSPEQPGLEGIGRGITAISGDVKLAAFALVLFAWSYLPYLVLFFAGRVTYPFYFLPAVPAVAMGCTYWLTRSWFPKWLAAVYLLVAFAFFFIYFPEKAFLPDWLRVLIHH